MSLTTAELQILITARDLASDVLDRAANKQDEVAKKIEKASMVMTAGFAAAGIGATALAVNFERDLDQVGAVANATEADMSSLREEALKLGADTAYSAGEAVAAAEELAAGGRSMAQIVGGEMRAAVNLAAAGNYGLAESAKVVATTLDIWKDGSLETTEVINRLAGAANASKFGVDDMAQAVAAGGGVAKLAGVDFGDFTTTIAATASAFSSGSDAGTSFKTFITALPGNSKEAKEAISELGLEFYNSNGQLKSMAEITQELNTKMGGLSEQQQTVYLKTIFGNDAFRTAAGLMAMTGAEFTAMSNKMRDTDAMDVAAQRMGNAAGNIEELKGSLETAAITLGTTFLPPLVVATEGATSFVNAFAGMPESTQLLILGSIALTTAMPAMVGVVSRGAAAVKDLADGAGTASSKLTLMAGGLAAVAVIADGILSATTGHGLIERIFGDVARSEAAIDATNELTTSIKNIQDPAERMDFIFSEINATVEEFTANGGKAQGAVSSLGYAIGGTDGRLFGFNVGLSKNVDALKSQQESVRAAFVLMDSYGASVGQLLYAYNQLPPELQAIADETSNVTQRQQDYAASMADSQSAYYAAMDAANEMSDGHKRTGETLEAVMTAGQLYRDQLQLAAGDAEAAKDATDGYSESLSLLALRFMEADPQFQFNAVRLARLNEELDDLTATNQTYSEGLGMTIEQIKAEIKARTEQNDAMSSNREAYDALVQAMAGYEGKGRVMLGVTADIDAAIRSSGLSLEDQVEAAGLAGEALSRLAIGDVPAARDAFLEFLGVVGTSPEKITEAIKAVGPAVWLELMAGINNPTKIAQLVEAMGAAGGEVGAAMVNGMMGAMNGGFAGLWEAGAGAANAATGGAAEASETRSPSKVWMRLGKDLVDGLDIGINDNLSKVRRAGTSVAREVTEGLQMESKTSVEALMALINALDDGARDMWWGANGWVAQAIYDAGYVVHEDGSVGRPKPAWPGSKATIVSGVPVTGSGNGPVNLPDKPAAPAKPKPTIVSGVPIVDSSMPPVPGGPGEGDWVPVPGSPGLYWSDSLKDFRYFGVDTGHGSFWDGRDFSGPGDPNGLAVYQDSDGVMRWVSDNSPVRNADGTVDKRGFDAIHQWRNYWAKDFEQGPGPQQWSRSATDKSIAEYNAGRMKQLEEAIKASPNQMDSHRASAFSDPFVAGLMGTSVFNDKGPPQWMIDAGLDEYGMPVWARYGWASDPWTGWTKTNASTYAGRIGDGNGAMWHDNWDYVYGSMGKPTGKSAGWDAPVAAESRQEIVIQIDGERFIRAVNNGQRSVREGSGWDG